MDEWIDEDEARNIIRGYLADREKAARRHRWLLRLVFIPVITVLLVLNIVLRL